MNNLLKLIGRDNELFIQDIANYEKKLLDIVSSSSFLVLGGAGSINDIKFLENNSNVSAFAAGSLFVFQDRSRGVLINYPSEEELLELCIMEKNFPR